MTDERKRSGWGMPILLLLMLYVMSIGPASRAWHTGLLCVDPKSIDAFYWPLENGAKLVGLFDALDAYMTWCDPQ